MTEVSLTKRIRITSPEKGVIYIEDISTGELIVSLEYVKDIAWGDVDETYLITL